MPLRIGLLLFVASATLAQPAILDAGYPKAYYFRWSESQANSQRNTYESFCGLVGGLLGIEGKVLDEEVRIDPTRKIAVFDRYKRDHPSQLVLLHVNGDGRDPGFEGQRFAAGHWLYYEGCTVTDAVAAEPGEAVLKVPRPELFRCGIGRLGMQSNEDVGLCALGEDGRPDWSRAEQLQLLATDLDAGTITVGRGAFGTTPLAFEAGRAYVAAHVGEGPWGPQDNRQLLWSYNYSTTCPKDAAGRDCSQVWIDHLAELFGPGGKLQEFDGLEFDVLWDEPFELPVYNPLGEARKIDVDADGVGENGVVGGANVFGYGVTDFLTRLRARLGDQRLILADGTHPNQQHAIGPLNGIESESFPENSDTELVGWSDGVNRHRYWAEHGHTPAFQYIAHKFVLPPEDGREMPPSVHVAPPNIHRAILAAACLTGAAVAVNGFPPAEPGETVGMWDELRGGELHQLGWLGQPVGPAERLATRAPDLLEGLGNPPRPGLLDRLDPVGCDLSVEGGQLLLRSTGEPGPLRFRLPHVACDGPDLFVRVEAVAEPVPGAPEDRPRLLEVAIVDDGLLVGSEPPEWGLRHPDGRITPPNPASGATVRYVPEFSIDGDTRAAYHVHPPWRNDIRGSVVWWREVTVPEAGRLTFATGLNERARGRSDGVTFRVTVESDGAATEVSSKHQAEPPWTAQTVDLSHWSGRTVRLLFEADPGPAGHTTTDHGAWADVRVGRPGAAVRTTTPAVRWSWVGPQVFEAGCYFQEVRPPGVELELRVTPGAPVRLRRLTLHAAPDVMLRRFEHGLVLANPSSQAVEFALPPPPAGQRWQRLRGAARQSPEVNDGQACGPVETVGPRDGRFLRAVEG